MRLKTEYQPLFVQRGLVKPLFILVESLAVIILFILPGAYLISSFGLAIIALFIGMVGLAAFLVLLFARDYEFHDDFLRITEMSKFRNIAYWEMQYCIQAANEIEKTPIPLRHPSMRLKVRDTDEYLIIKSNPFNQKLNMRLHEFLRKRTAPIVVHEYDY
ncbi:MAG: hypothetical protein JRN15_08855 [Nitrososphaerota archaeon]|nr:hypothetical protein [Nitrososphaerota archaeon]